MPPSACSKRPTERALAPVKAPFSWPNSSLSIRSRGIAAMLMATNGPVLALAVVVQRARDQLLAGAGLAGDHHRQVGLHQPREQRKMSCIAGERPTSGMFSSAASSSDASPPALRLGERAPDDRDQFLEIERLGQIFVGAALGRLDRGHEGVLRAHDDDRQIGPHAA